MLLGPLPAPGCVFTGYWCDIGDGLLESRILLDRMVEKKNDRTLSARSGQVVSLFITKTVFLSGVPLVRGMSTFRITWGL